MRPHAAEQSDAAASAQICNSTSCAPARFFCLEPADGECMQLGSARSRLSDAAQSGREVYQRRWIAACGRYGGSRGYRSHVTCRRNIR